MHYATAVIVPNEVTKSKVDLYNHLVQMLLPYDEEEWGDDASIPLFDYWVMAEESSSHWRFKSGKILTSVEELTEDPTWLSNHFFYLIDDEEVISPDGWHRVYTADNLESSEEMESERMKGVDAFPKDLKQMLARNQGKSAVVLDLHS